MMKETEHNADQVKPLPDSTLQDILKKAESLSSMIEIASDDRRFAFAQGSLCTIISYLNYLNGYESEIADGLAAIVHFVISPENDPGIVTALSTCSMLAILRFFYNKIDSEVKDCKEQTAPLQPKHLKELAKNSNNLPVIEQILDNALSTTHKDTFLSKSFNLFTGAITAVTSASVFNNYGRWGVAAFTGATVLLENPCNLVPSPLSQPNPRAKLL